MDALIIQDDFRRLARERLAELGWKQADLARAMDKSPQHISDYLNGRTSPGPDVIQEFFEAMGCRPRLIREPIPEWEEAHAIAS